MSSSLEIANAGVVDGVDVEKFAAQVVTAIFKYIA